VWSAWSVSCAAWHHGWATGLHVAGPTRQRDPVTGGSDGTERAARCPGAATEVGAAAVSVGRHAGEQATVHATATHAAAGARPPRSATRVAPHGEDRSGIPPGDPRWPAIVDAVQDALIVLRAVRDDDGVVVDFVYDHVNAVTAALLHRLGVDVIGRRLLDVVPALRGSAVFASWVDVVERGVPLDYEVADLVLGSTQSSFEGKAAKLGDGIVVTYRDVSERRATEQALRDSEARYRSVVDALGEGVMILDHEGVTVDLNPAAERIADRAAAELVGRRLDLTGFRAVRADGSPLRFADHPVSVTLRTGEPIRGVVIGIYAPDGTQRWVLVNTAPLLPAGGGAPEDASADRLPQAPAGVVLSFADITRLRNAEDEYRTVVEHSPDYITRYDREGRRLFVNRAMADAYGVQPDQLVGLRPDQLLDGSRVYVDQPSVRVLYDHLARVFDEGVATEYETSYESSDGARGVHMWLVPEHDMDGVVVAALAIGRDLSHVKRVERQLAEREERYRAVFDSSLDCLCLLEVVDGGRQFRNLEINPAQARSVGIPREELVGKVQEEVAADAATAEVINATLRRCVERGVPVDEEIGVDVPTGRRWYQSTLVPIHDERGAVTRIVGVARDVTERKAAEAEIHELNVRLEERVAERTAELRSSRDRLERFSYSVSHDLRTPLRGINGYSQILLEEHAAALDDDGAQLLGRIVANTERMSRLIDDLLALAKVGRKELHRRPVDVQALVRAVVDDLRAAEPARRIAVQTGRLLPALGDAALLRQVWENLLGNAVKFSAGRDVADVAVWSEARPGEVVYHVQDHGVGFDMAFAEKLFGVFERVHGAEYPGYGIGLAIVQDVVDRHGGQVWAEGREGEGATISFSLPAPLGPEER
jgi:PAS domain S-box-containing protein